MSAAADVLVLDDEPIVCEKLKDHLEKAGHRVEVFTDSEAAILRMEERSFDVVVTDLRMKGPTGMDVLSRVRDRSLATQVIIITGYGSMEAARDAEFLGVYRFVTKPFRLKELGLLIEKAAARARRIQAKGHV